MKPETIIGGRAVVGEPFAEPSRDHPNRSEAEFTEGKSDQNCYRDQNPKLEGGNSGYIFSSSV
jgi:hypothetical protein